MTATRLYTSLFLSIVVVGAARAQTVDLTEAPLVERCFRMELTFELHGKIMVQQQGQTVSFPHDAEGKHVYLERVTEAAGAIADKTVRHYEKAEVTITFNKKAGARRTLRPERAFMAVQRGKEETTE